MRVAVAGYGIAGIAAAILLRRQGHDITHFEQAEALGPAGGGLLLQDAGLRALDALGLVGAAMARGAPIAQVEATSRYGTLFDLRYGRHALGLQRGALFGLLRAADGGAVQTGRRIVNVDATRGFLTDAHGERFGPFDLIVAADGARSAVRARLPDLVQRERDYPWGALFALLEDNTARFEGRLLQRFDGVEHVSLWPVGRLTPQASPRVALSWRVAIDAPSPLLVTWKARVAELCPDASTLLAPLTTLQMAGYREVRLKRFWRDRVVFLGDAAHATSPQLGQGAGLALGDALALAAALAQRREISDALEIYDAARRPLARRYQRLSRILTPVFQSGSRTLATLRDRAFPLLNLLPFATRAMTSVLDGA
jgi:2-polyprenyl-6-methoxyphenol hydroxylase-like FAD-dependent oxidoreductase